MNHRKSTPLVTIAVICYNYGKYLEEAVNSALRQTYKNIEIIIINDGSTDDTDAIVKKIIEKNPKLLYHTHENMGVVATRNKAIDLAKGEYIIQLDADDHLDDTYIEHFVNKALETNADIVYGDYEMFEARTEKSNFPEFNYELLKNRNYINVSSLVKVESIKKIRFDDNLAKLSHEDWDFFLGVCAAGGVAVKCSDSVLHYRIHKDARNNQTTTISDQRRYVDMYGYIIDKYSKIYPGEFSYLIGGTFSHWYQELDTFSAELQKEIKKLQQDVQYQTNETLQVRQELFQIKNSKMYAYIERMRSVKHKLTKQ